jgi:hypothetical protein
MKNVYSHIWRRKFVIYRTDPLKNVLLSGNYVVETSKDQKRLVKRYVLRFPVIVVFRK